MAHPPEFAVGQPVPVLVNARNRTPRVGWVRRVVWHFKLACWMFYLEAGGRRVSKRYFADDLVSAPLSVTESPNPQGPGR